jgi:hypothetical protein
MYAALSRSACALPLNLILGFETTSSKNIRIAIDSRVWITGSGGMIKA